MTEAPQSALRPRRERLWPVVAASALAHAALVAGAVLHRPAPPIDLGQRPIVAKLVRLGEKRPQNFLPRKEQPPPAAAPTPAPPPPPEPSPLRTAAAPPAPTPKPLAPAPRPAARAAPKASPQVAAAGGTDVLASALSRVRRDKALEEPVYGDASGDALGDASEASEGDQYLALVERALRETYVLPSTISERDRLHLKATVVLYLDADGDVLRYSFEQRSGNGAFDAALERAIHAARLPPPPAHLRQRYRSEGLGVVYRP